MIRIGARNLLRNKRRTLMSLAILSAAAAILFLARGFIESSYAGLRLGSVARYGNLQIAAEEFWDKSRREPVHIGPEIQEAVEEFLISHPDASDLIPTLSAGALLGSERTTDIVSLVSVVPQEGSVGLLLEGTPLDTGRDGLLLGKGLREKLGAETGDWLVLMGRTVDGALNALESDVKGIVTFGGQGADDFVAMADLAFVQHLLDTDGIDYFRVYLDDEASARDFRRELEDFIDARNLALDTRTWQDLDEFYFSLKSMYDFVFGFLSIILFLIVFLAVFEIISVSFYERFAEAGSLLAVGMRKYQLFLVFAWEVLILALGGIVLGGALGKAAGELLNSLRLSWLPPMTTLEVPFSFLMSFGYLLLPGAFLLATSLFAGLVPAVKVINLDIKEVLSHV